MTTEGCHRFSLMFGDRFTLLLVWYTGQTFSLWYLAVWAAPTIPFKLLWASCNLFKWYLNKVLWLFLISTAFYIFICISHFLPTDFLICFPESSTYSVACGHGVNHLLGSTRCFSAHHCHIGLRRVRSFIQFLHLKSRFPCLHDDTYSDSSVLQNIVNTQSLLILEGSHKKRYHMTH